MDLAIIYDVGGDIRSIGGFGGLGGLLRDLEVFGIGRHEDSSKSMSSKLPYLLCNAIWDKLIPSVVYSNAF